MKLMVIIEDNSIGDKEELMEKIHLTLKGNQDYLDNNIVLGDTIIDKDGRRPTNNVMLFFSKDDCKDKEYIRDKAKEAIDLILNN